MTISSGQHYDKRSGTASASHFSYRAIWRFTIRIVHCGDIMHHAIQATKADTIIAEMITELIRFEPEVCICNAN